MVGHVPWLPIKTKPWRRLLLASYVIGFSLKEWFSWCINQLAKNGRTQGLPSIVAGVSLMKCNILWAPIRCSSYLTKPDGILVEVLKSGIRHSGLYKQAHTNFPQTLTSLHMFPFEPCAETECSLSLLLWRVKMEPKVLWTFTAAVGYVSGSMAS